MPKFFVMMLLLAAIFLPFEAVASSALLSKENRQIDLNLDIGQGVESNVFLSNDDPQSDPFTLLEVSANAFIKPSERSLVFAFFMGSYQHFSKLDQADWTFINLVSHYRYSVSSSLVLGLANTLSHADLKLYDTEGNAMPRDKFRSLSDQVRLYGLLNMRQRMDLELGIYYRPMNVEEIENQSSLDLQEFGVDISSRYDVTSGLMPRFKYKYSVLSYDEHQAYNRETSFDGLIDPGNPRLRLRRNDLSFSLNRENQNRLGFEITARLRFNEDRFEGHLSYREGEIREGVEIKDLKVATLNAEAAYKNRYYAQRTKGLGSYEPLKEEFIDGQLKLSRDLWKWFRGYLKYQ